MWYYDTSDRRCRQFYYGGCGGNENKFTTEEACMQRCEHVTEQPEVQPEPEAPPREHEQHPPSVPGGICEQTADVGDCSDYTLLWYYDTEETRCRQFYYGGCGGNDNRFATEDECSRRCSSSYRPPEVPDQSVETSQESSSAKCFLPAVSGNCLDYTPRWFYNSADGICEQFLYTGCHGNANNFASEDECESECFAAQPTCSLPPLRGNCSESIIRWHYDPQTRNCYEFEFSGCRPNRNNFNTERECLDFCSGDKRGPDGQPPAPV